MSEAFDAQIGRNVRWFRRRADLTQTQIAAALSAHGAPITQQVWNRIEHGKRPFKLEEAVIVAAILEVSLDEITWPAGPRP